jgi:NADPH:quinone reductase-like Zn-dependent oxidoreductase
MGHAALSLLTSPWAACVVDRVFPFEEIIETDLYLETNQQFGKIVVTV